MFVNVVTVKIDGIVVSAGHINSFIPNLYISNVEYSEKINTKYKQGLKIRPGSITKIMIMLYIH